jgi:electron-transferring-flavoprotein dehydrogenase
MLRVADSLIRAGKWMLPVKEQAFELPWTPAFLHKHGGFVCSLGQFNQWVANQLMASGTVQLWPNTPVAKALTDGPRVLGVQLLDQGTGRNGEPADGFMPGMEVRAALTVIGDGPVGPVGQQLDRELGLPEGHAQHDWAVGAKMVIDLPEGCDLEPGTVLHTFGYPEPEIFGFFYVHPGKVVSAGIFVPSWFDSPVRSTYRYLQHWLMHPYIWRYVKGGKLRSWGAKTLQESGRRGEPHLAGDGFARIGEGSGSTNVLTGSGVDEAWATGKILAEGVLQLLAEKKPFTRENLDQVYVQKRRSHRMDQESQAAEKSRDGFQRGVVTGMIGMALAGFTGGKLAMPGKPMPPYRRVPTIEEYYRGKISEMEIAKIRKDCVARGVSLHHTLMDRAGWPAIPFDGQLLVTHQDALLLGGKVQAPPGYADHVAFLYPRICEKCENQLCVEVCSGQAITPGPKGVPAFDREKCVHCGACLWNCTQPLSPRSEATNLQFRAGAGGLHSAEN